MAKVSITKEEVVDKVEDILSAPYLKTGLISVLSIVLGFLGLHFVPAAFSAFPAILGNVGIGLGIFYLIDRFALGSVNTLEEIKKGNYAYAIFLLAVGVIILGSILAT